MRPANSSLEATGDAAQFASMGQECGIGIRGELNKGSGCDLFDVEGSLGIDFAFTNAAIREQGLATRSSIRLMAEAFRSIIKIDG